VAERTSTLQAVLVNLDAADGRTVAAVSQDTLVAAAAVVVDNHLSRAFAAGV